MIGAFEPLHGKWGNDFLIVFSLAVWAQITEASTRFTALELSLKVDLMLRKDI